jgi:hypothetical protein
MEVTVCQLVRDDFGQIMNRHCERSEAKRSEAKRSEAKQSTSVAKSWIASSPFGLLAMTILGRLKTITR